MDVRTGNGFDVHAFGPGDHVTLCGVRVALRPRPRRPFRRRRRPARADRRDLRRAGPGRHRPAGSRRRTRSWKGAASAIFLAKAVRARRATRGFAITHLDCTLVCEAPKIGPHAAAMRAARRRDRRHRRRPGQRQGHHLRAAGLHRPRRGHRRARHRDAGAADDAASSRIAPRLRRPTSGPAPGTWGSLAALAARLPAALARRLPAARRSRPSPSAALGYWATAGRDPRAAATTTPARSSSTRSSASGSRSCRCRSALLARRRAAARSSLAGLGRGLPALPAASTSGSPGRSAWADRRRGRLGRDAGRRLAGPDRRRRS